LQKNFEAALKHVLAFEGGYSDHPRDPGGATNLGITIRVLERYRGRPVTKDEVRTLTKKEARAIYRKFYWEPCRCGQLPTGLDFAVFDCAVNQGVARATRFLQQAARVAVDGQIGSITLGAVQAADREALLAEFISLRMQSYGLLQRLFRIFGLGWSRRLTATHAAALALMRGPVKCAVTPAAPKKSQVSTTFIKVRNS
jgi:lysozyme family protein